MMPPNGSVAPAGEAAPGDAVTVDRDRLRDDAVGCLLAAIRAVDPADIVARHLESRRDLDRPVVVAGIGKAAGAMAAGARAVLGSRLARGVLIVPEGIEVEPIPGIDVYHGGHPTPNERGVEGAAAIHDMASSLGADDLLLCLISGGGSALMTLPPEGISLEHVRQTTDLLLRAGATIQELNCVRKHLDRLKGGRLARAAAPARVLALVLSDVIGDPLDVIASGPVSPDSTTFGDAIRILEARGLWNRIPGAVRDYLERGGRGAVEESPKPNDPAFDSVEVQLVGNNRIAAAAAVREAEQRGYSAMVLSTSLMGEAREVGRVLAAIGREIKQSGQPLRPPACIVAAGETTVTVVGDGRGGRNQELTLGAAIEIAGVSGIVVGSVGTDGIDGPTDAAGAVVDGTTVERARDAGFDARAGLARNDSYAVLQAARDLIVTGPTGTNVMDIQVVLVRP